MISEISLNLPLWGVKWLQHKLLVEMEANGYIKNNIVTELWGKSWKSRNNSNSNAFYQLELKIWFFDKVLPVLQAS